MRANQFASRKLTRAKTSATVRLAGVSVMTVSAWIVRLLGRCRTFILAGRRLSWQDDGVDCRAPPSRPTNKVNRKQIKRSKSTLRERLRLSPG
jgi:hypothetical protein